MCLFRMRVGGLGYDCGEGGFEGVYGWFLRWERWRG